MPLESLDDPTTAISRSLAVADTVGVDRLMLLPGDPSGGRQHVATLAETQDDFDGPDPDASATGWVRPPEADRVDAVFVLSNWMLGVGRVQRVTPPVWLNLEELVNLDAVGDPVDGIQEVELTMEDRSVVGAGWPLSFCDSVVEVLQTIHAGGSTAAAADTDPAAPDATVDASDADEAPKESDVAEVTPMVADAEASASAPASPVTDDAAGADTAAAPTATLDLEDVVYLGGYPGQGKKRKRCAVSMTSASLDLSGPSGLEFSLPWDSVTRIEIQNADEARFRINTKIHRDASALVLECVGDTTVLLEARECPTIPLRSAITQLLDGSAVNVV